MVTLKSNNIKPNILKMYFENPLRVLFGVILLFTALLLFFSRSWMMEYIAKSFFILTPNSLFGSLWVRSPVPIFADVYLFNWTNPLSFSDITTKPRFEEVKPLRFINTIEKVNLIWHQSGTVSFRLRKTYYHDPQWSNEHYSDEVTTMNVVSVLLASLIQNSNSVVKSIGSLLIDTVASTFYFKGPVKDIIYDGIENFLAFAAQVLPLVSSSMPEFENFSLISMVNTSTNLYGVLNVSTSAKDNFNIQRWNNHKRTPYFKGVCGQVRGSTGEKYPENLKKEYITLFVPEICRYVKLDYLKEVEVNGIVGYKFVVGNSLLDNGTIIEENKCFCGKKCIPSGMLSLESCRLDFPLFISMPHFYQADPVYLEAVEGLEPIEEKHEGYIVVEPITGLPISVYMAVQINLLIQPVEGIRMYEDVRSIYIPLLWVRVSTTITPIYALALKSYLYLPWIMTCISACFGFLGIYTVIKQKYFGTHKHRREWNEETHKDYRQNGIGIKEFTVATRDTKNGRLSEPLLAV